MKSIKEVKEKVDRKLIGYFTGVNEFTYENKSWVRENIPYSIYYTRDKEEYYISETTIPEFIFRKNGHTSFAEYRNSKSGDVSSTKFVKSYTPKVKKADIKRGYMIRYFVQPVNRPNLELTEINKSSYDNNLPYYKKRKISWKIVGAKNAVIEENKRAIKYLNNQYPNTFIMPSYTEY